MDLLCWRSPGAQWAPAVELGLDPKSLAGPSAFSSHAGDLNPGSSLQGVGEHLGGPNRRPSSPVRNGPLHRRLKRLGGPIQDTQASTVPGTGLETHPGPIRGGPRPPRQSRRPSPKHPMNSQTAVRDPATEYRRGPLLFEECRSSSVDERTSLGGDSHRSYHTGPELPAEKTAPHGAAHWKVGHQNAAKARRDALRLRQETGGKAIG